jgi:hypothetical protein
MPADDAATPAEEPADELARLRSLVGPSEVAYEALRVDRDAAQMVARDALAETGELRGTIQEMRVQLARARQDQDVLLRRAQMTPTRRTLDRAVSRWRTSVAPRAAQLLGRFRPS